MKHKSLRNNSERRTRPKQFTDFTAITCTSLLVERLGVGGGGSDVGIAGSLVGTGLLLEGLDGSTGCAMGRSRGPAGGHQWS
jgi:hypothetical protein